MIVSVCTAVFTACALGQQDSSSPASAIPEAHSSANPDSTSSSSSSAPSASPEYTFTISAAQAWTDTGVDLPAGQSLVLTAEPKTGSVCNSNSSTTAGADALPLASAPAGTVIARTSQSGEPFAVGSRHELKTETAGHLFLGVNVSVKSDCAFVVKLKTNVYPEQPSVAAVAAPKHVKDQLSSAAKVWLQGQFGNSSASAQSSNATDSNATEENATATGTAAKASANASSSLKLPTVILDAGLRQNIDGLPRRVHDHAGNLGDMVNFVIIGSQENTQAALQAAEWHVADLDSKEAGLKAILNTYQKKDYLEMPMSHLFLFDRMQDYGYEQAQVYAVVATRHHFRLWKAPFTWNGETVWVGAGTHDIGFEKDMRTGKLTHKIDPAVDGERENIAQSLEKSGKTRSMTYYQPPNPVLEAKNASGGGYHSDGKLLVVFLK